MANDYQQKSSVEDIRRRFDADVERFSNLETGQTATVDAVLVLDLITQVAGRLVPQARHVLDIGCGAGNYTLKLLQVIANLDVSLVDLSGPMLARAIDRIRPQMRGQIDVFQADIRELDLGGGAVRPDPGSPGFPSPAREMRSGGSFSQSAGSH